MILPYATPLWARHAHGTVCIVTVPVVRVLCTIM